VKNIATRLSLLSFLLLSACTVGQKVGSDQYQSFQEGKTTRAEIVAALGEPNGSSWVGQEETLSYSFVASDKRGYIPVVGAILLAVDGVKSEVQVCGFTVDAKKLLKVKTCSGSAQKVGGLTG
jgi:hypothetical protein